MQIKWYIKAIFSRLDFYEWDAEMNRLLKRLSCLLQSTLQSLRELTKDEFKVYPDQHSN